MNINIKHLLITVTPFFAACSSNDEPAPSNYDNEGTWTECAMDMNGAVNGFDGSTRADYVWPDNARVYISFTKADGTSTYGSAVYNKSDAKWTLSYNGRLDSDKELTCKVYYFEGDFTDDALHTSVTTKPTTAVYGCENGGYSYNNGNVNLTAELKPLTSRLRFYRTENSGSNTGLLRNIQTITSFNLKTCEFTKSTPSDPVTINFPYAEAWSNYIYGTQDFEYFPTLKGEIRIKNGSYVFTYELPENSDFMKTGDSGYMQWPTTDSHNGWYVSEYVSGKQFSMSCSSTSSAGNTNSGYAIQTASKGDIVYVTLGNSSYFYPNSGSSYRYSAYFSFEVSENGKKSKLFDFKYDNYDSGKFRYFVNTTGTLMFLWEACYWYMNSSYNYVEYTNF